MDSMESMDSMDSMGSIGRGQIGLWALIVGLISPAHCGAIPTDAPPPLLPYLPTPSDNNVRAWLNIHGSLEQRECLSAGAGIQVI